MKFKYGYVLLLIFSIGMISCKKSASVVENPLPADKAGVVKLVSGKNEVKLSFLVNPGSDISKAVIYWNALADSLVIPVTKENVSDTITTFIGGLTDKTYDFSFYTYSSKGIRSDVTLIREIVYGDLYVSKLVNREVIKALLEADGNLIIDWGFPTDEIGIEITYTDQDDVSKTVLIPRNEMRTILRRYKRDSKFEYRTLFKPQSNVIDYFHPAIKKDNVIKQDPALVGTILERIIANSGMVKTVTSKSTVNTYNGMEENYLQFVDINNNPQSLFIVQVDLNNENLSYEIGTPSDGAATGLQTVSEMINAKNENSKDKKVIAGINGDYFELATGIPSGPIVKNGIEIRTLSSASHCFVAALNNNLCVIGEGAVLYKSSIFDMKEAVGAKHLLVSNGVLLNPTDGARNPRTTAGVIGSSKLIFIVLDGRQPGYSVGLNLNEIGAIHKAIGVKNAVNLDGGGSSTFIIKDNADKYIIKNKVSDGSPRKVGNSLLIMQKSN